MHVTSLSSRHRGARGFTLIELLVTLAIVAIGLLGVAKLQAAAVAETSVARTRALMTFQAESLAGAMRANEAFWQSSTVYALTSFPIAAGGVLPSVAASFAPTPPTCLSVSTCTPNNLAWYDLKTWADSFGARFPAATANIVCSGSVTAPVTCDITLQWAENNVAINRTTAAAAVASAAAGAQTQSYMVLHIQP